MENPFCHEYWSEFEVQSEDWWKVFSTHQPFKKKIKLEMEMKMNLETRLEMKNEIGMDLKNEMEMKTSLEMEIGLEMEMEKITQTKTQDTQK